jgi:diguanylate cyclase (GGDEF)-like protein
MRSATTPDAASKTVRRIDLSFYDWGTFLVTILTVMALAGQFVQSLHDFHTLEERTSTRLDDLGLLAGNIVNNQMVSIRQIFDVLELSMETGADGTVTLPGSAQLQEVRDLYNTSLPGLELLVLDEHANYVAESDPDLRNSTPGIPRMVALLQQPNGPAEALDFTTTLQGYSVIAGKAYIDSEDHRRAFMIAVVPARSIMQALSQLALELQPLVTLQTASGQLLGSYPELPAAVVGEAPPVAARSGAGPLPGSYYEISPLDGMRRLMVQRDISLPLADERWTLKIGYAVRDYRRGWYVSTGINIVVCSILLVSWMAMILSRLQLMRMFRYVNESWMIVEQLLVDLPMPFILVTQSDHRIARGNDALRKIFGAIAGPGGPVAQLFSNEEDCTALMQTGARQTVSMVTRSGVAYMLVTCSEVSGLTSPAGPCWLFTLVDVTEQHLRHTQLQSEATTDPLTGLANRRSFSVAAELEVARARKQQSTLAVLTLDLDSFKRINDKYGHGTGDVVLVHAARLLKSAMRDGDLAARLGGEEFAVLLPETILQHAMAIAERIRRSIATSPVVLPDGGSLSVTMSIGVALYHEHEYDLSDALERADQALYRAKEAGRNRVEPEVPPDASGQPSAAT